jgi:hypothetical protein
MSFSDKLKIQANQLINSSSINHFEDLRIKVYVGNSKIHGKGIFAINNINKDDLITFYPAHYAIIYPNGKKFRKKLLNLVSFVVI